MAKLGLGRMPHVASAVVDEKGVPAAQGSGVVTGPGLIVTPCHVAQAGKHRHNLESYPRHDGWVNGGQRKVMLIMNARSGVYRQQ